MKKTVCLAAAIAVPLLLNCAAKANVNIIRADPANPNTARVVGFTPWMPAGFSFKSATIMSGAPMPEGVVRYPELILTGSLYSLPVVIHEYRQARAVGESDLFVDDPRVARLIPVWPADHAIIDRSGLIVGLLVQRGSVHFDFHLKTGIPLSQIRPFLKKLAPIP